MITIMKTCKAGGDAINCNKIDTKHKQPSESKRQGQTVYNGVSVFITRNMNDAFVRAPPAMMPKACSDLS